MLASCEYQEGTTIDPATGRHRLILSTVQGRIGDHLWEQAEARTALLRRLLASIGALGEGPRARAAELLLFEVIHEKSFPLDRAVLGRELTGDAHLAKLRSKVAGRFFPTALDAATIEALPAARSALMEALS
jgi:hypothetical protein